MSERQPEREIKHDDIEIRSAVPDDAEIICSIRDEAWIDTYPNEELRITEDQVRINARGLEGEFVPRRIAWLREKLAGDDPNLAAYVSEVDGIVRGFVIASVEEDGIRFLNSLYVRPGFQGSGIGYGLMERALTWLGDGNDIHLDVARYNDRAIRFYEGFGFEKTDNPVPEEPNRPSYVMPIPQIEMVRKSRDG